jgi:leader peptidase (prepilin peptidase)/N-methyltransferase
MVVLRWVRFLFTWARGVEGLGLGDADLMMMAGAFIGWQPVVMAFFVAAFPALFFGLVQLMRKGDQRLPFGPSLAIAVLLTVLLWPNLGPPCWLYFSDPLLLVLLAGAGTILLVVTAVMLRFMRGVPAEPAEVA